LEAAAKSFKIDPTVFPRLSKGVESMALMPDGVIIVSYKGGFALARPLDELSGESLISIMEQILPKARTYYIERRKNESDKAAELEHVATELKKIKIVSETTMS